MIGEKIVVLYINKF